MYLNDCRAKKIKADFVSKLKEFKRRPTISPYIDFHDFRAITTISALQ